MTAVSTLSSTTSVNTVLKWVYPKTVSAEASAVAATIPNTGISRLLSRANWAGNSRSRAAAMGISAQISVHPFRAPIPEMIAATAIALPAHEPPKMAFAEAENGVVDDTSLLWGTVPNTVSVPRI